MANILYTPFYPQNISHLTWVHEIYNSLSLNPTDETYTSVLGDPKINAFDVNFITGELHLKCTGILVKKGKNAQIKNIFIENVISSV